ncbi:MAG TPA: thiamine pyrophosphate-binding protein, partial [Dehalococcoidia bacterium]
MKVSQAIAEILKREGVQQLFAYPLNPLIEAAAEADIRPIIVRQERTGVHMADAYSRMTSGNVVGVFCMQAGPGVENSFGAVAQAYSEAVPLVVIPGGSARTQSWVKPAFNATLNYQHVTKWAEQITTPAGAVAAMRRAFTQARNGRPGPVLIEVPGDLWGEEVPEPFEYTPTVRALSRPDAQSLEAAAQALVDAQRPVIYAGQGVHYAKAWEELKQLAELLEAPVTTSLEGKSAFPESHALALGSGGRSVPKPVHHFLQHADVIFGIGCSFSTTNYGVALPRDKPVIHATLDVADINKDLPVEHALVGDAGLTLAALVAEVRDRLGGRPRGR